ncbi:MAG: TolC family protein, partial [Desulfuromonadaceae bacterium]|nr:TolC family protein [Desulfuromonadaceae bacterium]
SYCSNLMSPLVRRDMRAFIIQGSEILKRYPTPGSVMMWRGRAVGKQTVALADIEQQVAREVIKAYADSASALQNREASAILLESAQSALAVSQRKYDKGAADITEVLSTQAALADAWNERVRCLSEWHSSRLQLLASTGRMGRFAVSDASKAKP